jgi:hypothetical protein
MKLVKHLTIIAAIALAACQPKATTKPGEAQTAVETKAGTIAVNPSDSLEARSEKRWQHIIAGEFEKAYTYLSPGYRQTRALDQYVENLANRPVRWTEADYEDQSCSSEDVCTVKVMIKFNMDMPVTNVGRVESLDYLEEKWLRVDGVWYFLPTQGGSTANSGR